ncbi:hypothetical protein IMG5_201520 [Ichthyophthirius multifiliis]|uniref:Uncharacterized protein n=1 Tax=Ichthyophthirius multifiliis TaxID=5932 RepID=G0R603_ICHMU|nr:hypothetical protein IMG5_201520 [Ichthyophthirius multifiliis]EGR27127.1 hypothetical protein IMG5_201520 [Ichthyophthirius multifiliis]|eukprot:XP_004024011.1 hypothetical protein IMG5_201520 [Ichthyophthirius multifiliis]
MKKMMNLSNNQTSNKINALKCNKGLFLSFQEKVERNQQKKELKDKMDQLKDEFNTKLTNEKKRLKQKQKQQELNTFKSSTYQIIKDTKKIKQWNRKARQSLAKLPSELYEKLIKKEYGY